MTNKKDDNMNGTQLRALLQYAATAAASYLAGKGYMTGDQAYGLMMWIAAGVPVLIGIWQERDAGKLNDAASVKDDDGTHVTIIAPDKLANATPKTNVIPASSNQVAPK